MYTRALLFSIIILGSLSVKAQWWSITGNAGTTPPTNFIGTTDNVDIVLKRNNIRCGFLGTTNTSFGLVTTNTGNVGTYNSSFGVDALKSTTTGIYNTAIGFGTISNNLTGNYNTAVGAGALSFGPFIPANNTGSSNTGIGFGAGVFLTSGSGNTLIGYTAGNNISTGSNNTVVGSANTTGITTGSNNTILGANITGLSSTLSNNIILADGSGNQRIKVNNVGDVTIPDLAGVGTRTVIVDANGLMSATTLSTQILSFTNPNLSLSGGGGSVNLSALKDNLGNHTATTNLNMTDRTIYAINTLEFSQSQNIYGGNFGTLEFGASVGIWTNAFYELDVSGQTRCSSGIWIASDVNYKKNIQPIQSALDNILKLQGVSYNWKREEYKEKRFNDGLNYGIIAQELEKVYPNMVETDNLGYKSVSYDMLIPVLIEGVKEQQDIINQQNERISKLEEAINNGNNNFSGSTNPAILYQNSPNPFDQRTQIKCLIPANALNAQLRFYDLNGTLIETKIIPGAGEQIILVEGSTYISNIYVYSLYVNDNLVDSKKMIVNK